MSGGCLGFLPSTVSCKNITGKQPSQWIVFSYIKVAESWKNSSTYPRYFFISPSHHQDTIALFPSTKRNTSSNKHRRSSFYLKSKRKVWNSENNKGGRSFHVKKGRGCNPCKKNLKHLFCCFLPPQKKMLEPMNQTSFCAWRIQVAATTEIPMGCKVKLHTISAAAECESRSSCVFFVALLLSWAIFNTPFRCGC